MTAWRLMLALIGIVAFALSGTARADLYGSSDAPIHIAWQMQPTQSPKSSGPSFVVAKT